MLELQSLQQQLEALRAVFDNEIKSGKTLEQVKETFLQIKEVQRLIYERKVLLKRKGDY